MKVNPRFIIFLLVISTLIIISYDSRPDRQPILRASIDKIRGYLTPNSTGDGYLEKLHKQLPTKPFQLPKILTDQSEKETELLKQSVPEKEELSVIQAPTSTKEKTELNLSLPDDWELYEWEKPTYYSSYPNFFVPKEKNNKRFGVSGALHLDDSDEANDEPLEKTILGGEVELKWMLP